MVAVTLTVTQTPTATALYGLADTLTGLSQARVSPPDMYRALRVTIRDTEARYQAYGAFTSYVRSTPGYDGWLDNWTGPRSRVEVVALVREAADRAADRFRPCYEHGYVDCGCPEQAGAVSRG